MVRGLLAGLALTLAAIASAADPPRFRWQPGQELTYSSEQITTVVETTVEDGRPVTTATATRLALTRRWLVKEVGPDGIATLELTVLSMKQQIARPGPRDRDGNPTIDRTLIDSSTAEGRQQLAAVLDRPVAVVKVDARGDVVEVLAGPADRLRTELPFRVVLPGVRPAAGGSWERSLAIRLPPPLGTEESFDAKQTFTWRGESADAVTIGVVTAPKTPPGDPADLTALLPMLWQGEVTFSPASGRYTGAELAIKREVPNHLGEGTRFAYESRFTERLLEKR